MRTLVTGGAGFLGGHLCERLLVDGHSVICLDNLFTGDKSNIAHLLDRTDFEFIRHDVVEPVLLEVDWIFNLACPASPPHYQHNPVKTVKTSVMGALNMLGLAKRVGARILQASTSEVYGDPAVHPQTEGYWGNVNPIGPRSCYDEGKRVAETLMSDYHRQNGVDARIARIFNSILADQHIVAMDSEGLHIERAEDYMRMFRGGKVLVPAFDPKTRLMTLKEATYFLKHPSQDTAFELKLRYGRSVKVTGDHSVFVRGRNGDPVATPVRDIEEGDYVAIPSRLPVVEADRECVSLIDELSKDEAELWEWAVRHETLSDIVSRRREDIHALLLDDGHYKDRRTVVCATNKWMKSGEVPLFVFVGLGLSPPDGTEIRSYSGSNTYMPATVRLTNEMLWAIGLYVAEGAEHSGDGAHFVSFASEQHYLDRAKSALESGFGLHVGAVPGEGKKGAVIYLHSKAVHRLFVKVLGLHERNRRIPSWVIQLPLSRLKYFLDGFRCGDGTHSGKKVGKEMCFDTASEDLAVDLSYLLLRFGVLACFGRYKTTFRQKYGNRKFPFYRLTVCEVNNFNILSWDQGVIQTLNAHRDGDLVWSLVRKKSTCVLTSSTYDFSVPGAENFVAGNGVCCHNTYGPRMRSDDGRVVSNFVVQALRGEPLTVYGDGEQTRSFCYVDDLVAGLVKLMEYEGEDTHLPVNLGNPREVSMLELTAMIGRAMGRDVEVTHLPLPADDPVRRRPDISRARSVLGWEPTVELEEGIEHTVQWFSAPR